MADRTTADVPALRRPVPEDAVAAVFARAAALDLEHAPGTAPLLLDEDALVEIGAAVGLTPGAVRQAVAEHRAGALAPAAVPPATWVGPRLAVVERRLGGDPVTIRRAVGRDLERQWFRRVRDQGERSVWSSRQDVAARVARRVDLRHRLVLEGVSAVVVTTVPCHDGDVVVRLEADPAERRDDLRRGVAGTATAAAAAGLGLALFESVGLDTAALLALPSAGAGAWGGRARARARYLDQLRRLADDLEALLDRVQRSGR